MKTLLFSLLIILAVSVQAQITSTFDTGADGWKLINDGDNDTLTVLHNTSGGNPGSYVSAVVPTDNYPGYFWYAPAKFLGNLTYTSLGLTLTYSQQQLVTGNNGEFNGNYYEIYSPDIIISSGNSSIYYHTSPKPTLTPGWTTYTVTLDETSPWHTGAYTSSPLATREQIKAALINVTSFMIRGNYNLTANTIGFDHVILGKHPIVISPSLTSFSPTSGKPGTSITINGNNFDPTASNNAVYFGAVAGTITNATTTQLTVSIPTGAQYGKISIVNKVTGLSGSSVQPFNPLFDGGGRIIPASFPNRSDIAISINQEGFTLADLDGDGWIDFAATSNEANVIDIYLNLGLGGAITPASFAPKVTLTTVGDAANGAGLQFKDLDGDGKLDLTTSVGLQFGAASFATLRNISTPGNIIFESPQYWKGGSDETPPYFIGDIDGDGRPDLVGGEGSSGAGVNLWIAQNISSPGNIEISTSVGYFSATVDGLSGVSMGDLDGDGKPEMLASWFFGDRFSIIQNNSTPGIISMTDIGQINTGQYNRSLQVADFNGDGKNDLVWKKSGGGIYIRLNTNTGGALAITDFSTDIILPGDVGAYGGMSIADINGDGKPDIVATDDGDIGVYENVFSGGVFDANAFVMAYQFFGGSGSSYPTSPLIADLNGDAKPDLVFATTNTNPSRVSIFENKNIHAPVISLNTVSPLKGAVGSTVTITGNNFSTVPSENMVWFGTVKATVLTASENLLTAEVPAGATYAPVSVTKNGLTSRYHLPFQTTFGPGVTFDNTHFAPPVSYTLTGANYNLDIGDLNRDGMPDIIAGGTASNTYAFRNSHTTGAIINTSLVPDDTIASSLYPRLEDFDGDGYFDVMSVNGPLRKNNSTLTEISFLPQVIIPLGASIVDFADFNNDGKIDMTLTTDLSGAGDLLVLENRSTTTPGNFATGTYGAFSQNFVYNKPSADGAAITGDFDGDGFADIVTTNPTADNISIYRNLGVLKISTAQFAARVDVAVGDNPNRIYKGDFDSDGKLDLLLYHWTGTSTTLLIVLQNTSTVGSISFSRIDLTNPNAVTVAHIADLDGDGKPEILTTAEANNRFSIFKNLHTSGALTAASFGVPFNTTVTAPRAIATADINLDGKPEIVLTRAAGLLVVYENLISSGPTISINPQPASTAVCDGATTSFTLTATGTTNLTYQWQKFDGTVFTNITNTGGYSGVTTSTLSINTLGNFGSGDYRCEVKGDLAPDKFSNTVTLTVNTVPTAPTTTSASNCVAAAITLNASGGINGQYRWYDVATGGTAIPAQVNSSYTTPVIATTTTYHVAIHNGFCESSRTPVIATIAPLAKPTLTPSVQAVSGTINICAGDALTITAPSGFATYTWSNGATTNPITISASTSALTLQVKDGAGCDSPMSDALNIVVNPYPIATITPNGSLLTASSGDSYQWYQNDNVVVGATDQSFEFNVLEYGKYKVDVTDNGCTSTSEEFEYLITGFENLNEGIKLYPNPADRILTIEYHPPYTITIINTNGSIAYKANSNARATTIDFSSLASGIYILQLKNENGFRYHRITKK